MNKQLKLGDIESGPDIQDSVHKKLIESIEPAAHLRVIGRRSESGLHEVGFLNKEDDENTKDQPVLIQLPGLGHGNWCFSELQRALAEGGIENLAVSPTGEPQSNSFNKPVEELVLKDYVEPLAEYIRNQAKDVVLLGYSLGGLMAQQLTAELGDKVRGLYLINSVKASNYCYRIVPATESGQKQYMAEERKLWLDEIYGDRKDEIENNYTLFLSFCKFISYPIV